MTEKTLEERIERLEDHAHECGYTWLLWRPEDAETNERKEVIKREIEKLQMDLADIETAKKKGTVLGDPIIVIE